MAIEERPSFADAIKVEKLDSHNYKANLHAAFSISAGRRGHSPFSQRADRNVDGARRGDGLLPHAPWVTRGVTRRIMVAYTTQISLRTFTGITLPTGYESTAVDSIPTQPDLQALAETGSDEIWAESRVPKPLTKMMSWILLFGTLMANWSP